MKFLLISLHAVATLALQPNQHEVEAPALESTLQQGEFQNQTVLMDVDVSESETSFQDTLQGKKRKKAPRPTAYPTAYPTKFPTTYKDSFTMIFISDLEVNYRDHTTYLSKGIVNDIKTLKRRNLRFSDGQVIDPKIVVHGGDNTDWVWGDTSDAGFDAVWKQLYDAKIPMISVFGNHDFSFGKDNNDKPKNKWKTGLNKGFVTKSINAAKKLGVKVKASVGPKFSYGPSFYNLEFKGVQFTMFDLGPFNPSYDTRGKKDNGVSQTRNFFSKVDTSKPTIFTAHFPWEYTLNYGEMGSSDKTKYKAELKKFLQKFPKGSGYFAGHTHRERRTDIGGTKVKQYVAPYPWNYASNPKGVPGYYAVQVSPSKGVIEVKSIKTFYYCKKHGELCGLGTTCQKCCLNIQEGGITRTEWWWGKAMTACGKEPCWKKGTRCLPGTSCRNCCNGSKHIWSWKFWKIGSYCQ